MPHPSPPRELVCGSSSATRFSLLAHRSRDRTRAAVIFHPLQIVSIHRFCFISAIDLGIYIDAISLRFHFNFPMQPSTRTSSFNLATAVAWELERPAGRGAGVDLDCKIQMNPNCPSVSDDMYTNCPFGKEGQERGKLERARAMRRKTEKTRGCVE